MIGSALNYLIILPFLSQLFQRELGGRQRNFDKIMKTGENMITEGHVEEPEKLEKELTDLKLRWEALCTMSVTKQERLMNSLVLSKEMQSGSQALVRRLIELEDVLKKQGPIADEIAPLRNQIDEFQVRFISILVCKLILKKLFSFRVLCRHQWGRHGVIERTNPPPPPDSKSWQSLQ